MLKNNLSQEYWSFTEEQVEEYTGDEEIILHFMWRFLGILKLAFGLFLVSNVTSIYNKMTIICAPVFILVSCKVLYSEGGEQSYIIAYYYY